MNIHQNAKTTPQMRAPIAALRQAGETLGSIAEAVGVSAATVSKWVRRFAAEGVAGLPDRSSRPPRRQTRATDAQKDKVEALAPNPPAVLADRG